MRTLVSDANMSPAGVYALLNLSDNVWKIWKVIRKIVIDGLAI